MEDEGVEAERQRSIARGFARVDIEKDRHDMFVSNMLSKVNGDTVYFY